MLFYLWLDDGAPKRLPLREGAFLVRLDEPTVPSDIRRQNGSEPSLDALAGQAPILFVEYRYPRVVYASRVAGGQGTNVTLVLKRASASRPSGECGSVRSASKASSGVNPAVTDTLPNPLQSSSRS